ncbi:hypothetical protein CDO87_14055 [Sagittula sp. P11]|uniref:hypothetical protein n=1 Tax=Sagittula sp. P11 TaxID=2009329 RepID=UPI000C2D653A|nr:hypothetical protein [Sagittula sp. P11]AUC54229.1 hypothetical protein CDO87_14055 [Sagittula sp. P11]
MNETETRLHEALENMFDTEEDTGNKTLEVTARELANAAEVEGKTGSVSTEAALAVLREAAGPGDEIDGETARFAMPRNRA